LGEQVQDFAFPVAQPGGGTGLGFSGGRGGRGGRGRRGPGRAGQLPLADVSVDERQDAARAQERPAVRHRQDGLDQILRRGVQAEEPVSSRFDGGDGRGPLVVLADDHDPGAATVPGCPGRTHGVEVGAEAGRGQAEHHDVGIVFVQPPRQRAGRAALHDRLDPRHRGEYAAQSDPRQPVLMVDK